MNNTNEAKMGTSQLAEWMRPESFVTATGAGPLCAGIAFALSTQIGIPSGWGMIAAAFIFAACVPAIHKKETKMVRGAFYLATALVLFLQSAQFSTVMSHSSADLDDHVRRLGDAICGLIPEAGAMIPAHEPKTWTVDRVDDAYVLTPIKSGAPIVLPDTAVDALLAYIRERKAKEVDVRQQRSPWKIRF